jgi:hypothetical protein
MNKVTRNQAVPTEFTENFSVHRQPVTVQERVLNAYARTTAAVKRKEQEWKLRVELAQIAEAAVIEYVSRSNYI